MPSRLAQDEDVDLQPGLEVHEVKAPALADGAANLARVHAEVLRDVSLERLCGALRQLDDEIDISRLARDAVDRTRDRSADLVALSVPFQPAADPGENGEHTTTLGVHGDSSKRP